MSQSEPKGPGEPPAPPVVTSLRWFIHQLFGRDGEVRRSPIGFIVVVVAVVAPMYFLTEWLHSAQTALKDATIENQRSRIATLEGQLKGASPQLAAVEARRVATRGHLHEMYIAAGSLLGRSIPNWAGQSKDPSALAEFEAAAKNWEQTTAAWIKDNLGLAAQERFFDISSMPPHALSYDDRHNTLLNRLSNLRKNLAFLIETTAYDDVRYSPK